GDQHPARHDRPVAGAGASQVSRDLVSRTRVLDGGARRMRRLEAPAVKMARGPVTARTAVPLRKRPRPAWMRWAIRFGTAFGGCPGIGGGLVWGGETGWLPRELGMAGDAALTATAEIGLNLQTVEVHGRGETRQADIVEALGAAHGAPLLGLDIDAM